jgi:phage N-6-adenine-methyltransferase
VKGLEDVVPTGSIKTGAGFARGRSKQDYRTPPELLDAVRAKFLGGADFTLDLAADEANHVCPAWYGPGGVVEDALSADWPFTGQMWLNPPFGGIAPWARRCREMTARRGSVARVYLLVPASVGSSWFLDDVMPHADVFLLRGRICFDGRSPFPKDCLLALYAGREETGFQEWDWRKLSLVWP